MSVWGGQPLADQEESLVRWAQAVGGKPKHWLFYYDYIFRNVDFAGKTVLDIGGGVGRSAYYAAVKGASRVVCVEPESDGSHSDMLKAAANIGDKLGLRDVVQFVTKPVQEANLDEQFDVVMMLNSINHLEEEACIRLPHDATARAAYEKVFAQISALTSPGGTILITDCSNENLSHVVVSGAEAIYRRVRGIKQSLGWYYNPVAPTIEYWKHQSPEIWAEMLSRAGFKHPVVRWTPDRRSGKFGERWLTSRSVAYCLQSHFCMTMTKGEKEPSPKAEAAISEGR